MSKYLALAALAAILGAAFGQSFDPDTPPTYHPTIVELQYKESLSDSMWRTFATAGTTNKAGFFRLVVWP